MSFEGYLRKIEGLAIEAQGTQLMWDLEYHHPARFKGSFGLHQFNMGSEVQRLSDGMPGRVYFRTALTASVQWHDGSYEEIQQFDQGVVVCQNLW